LDASNLDGPTQVSAYRTAIDQTTDSIARRARYFRNQIVTVVAIGALVAVGALVTRSVAALSAWLVLVSVCGLFFHADSRLLNKWRRNLLAPWIARELDFAALLEAIRANPALPKPTVEGMLATLPFCGNLVAEQAILRPTRQAIAAGSVEIHRSRAQVLLLNVVASAVVVAALLASVYLRRWTPLLGLAALVPLPLGRAWISRAARRRSEAVLATSRSQPEFSEADYRRVLANLR
jgi:hypothetical protein